MKYKVNTLYTCSDNLLKEKKKKNSPAGNRTRVFRVTGGDTYHYTTEEFPWWCVPFHCCLCLRIKAEQEQRWLAEREEMMKDVQEMRMRAEEDMEAQKREYESRLQELGAQMVCSGMCCVTVSEREGCVCRRTRAWS